MKVLKFLIVPLLMTQGMVQAQSIEKAEFISIGGIEQWITIRQKFCC